MANNPTIFALREAQLLWPDAKIDCLVSIGCGSVSTKVIADFAPVSLYKVVEVGLSLSFMLCATI